MKKQFPDVSSKHGAPMGRQSFGTRAAFPVEFFEVRMVDGDYDDGGAYWGATGDPLFCARGDGFCFFHRAKTRADALRALAITPHMLAPDSGLEDFIDAYIAALRWSPCDPDLEDTDAELAPETDAAIRADCLKFWRMFEHDISANPSQAGHDFWLTRCGSGSGFQDRDGATYGSAAVRDALARCARRFPEVCPHLGDDGLLYL